MTPLSPPLEPAAPSRPLRIGFAGVGWIGLNRLQAALEVPGVGAASVFDPSGEAVAKCRETVPDAAVAATFEELLDGDLDGVAIATPSALHAEQSIAALERGLAVFCQKPLARTQAETQAVVDAARAADRLLATDLSYRHVAGVGEMRRLVRSGELGDVYAIDLTFHNAYGPNKPWFFDYALAGGGCLIDLGTHLVDLALHLAGDRPVSRLEGRLFREGRRLDLPAREVEDFATVAWDFDAGPTVRLACSWNLSAGRDAVIEAVCYGSHGAVALRNVAGSFFDFDVERYRGTAREPIAEARGWGWGGGAIQAWAAKLASGGRYDRDCEELLTVAEILDRSYGR